MGKPKPENQKTRPDLADQEWLIWLDALAENRGIEVHAMYRSMLEWCRKKGCAPTRQRLLRWLHMERENMPMTYEPANFGPQAASLPVEPESDPLPDCPHCKNERFVETVVNPEAKYDWARKRMVPCPKCNK